MEHIHIQQKDKDKNTTTFTVTVEEDSSKTEHTVHVKNSSRESIAPKHTPEELVWAAFLFLLDRESKESILSEFNLSDITTYFPSFKEDIKEYL